MTNTLFTGDNLYVLNGMNSESVDLIYLDPPFNSKRMYSAPLGSKSAGASFKDMWTWSDVDAFYLEGLIDYPFLIEYIQSIQGMHGQAMMSYITYMAQRIVELHRVLKPTGSLYLHIDPTASHYLKIILDKIFGKANFRNEIVWCYSGPGRVTNHFKRKHDIILFYAKSANAPFDAEAIRVPYKRQTLSVGSTSVATGKRTRQEARASEAEALKRGKIIEDWWNDIGSGSHMPKHERLGYPTQKPLKLLERVIKASSKVGDVVLDPFCGCATAMVAAQQLDRKWIGIDIETKTVDILLQRLSDDAGLFADFIHRTDLPKRTDLTEEPQNTALKERLYASQNKLCNGCETEMEMQHFEIDHIVPQSKGGGNYYENYQLLCGNCNRTKGNRPMEYLRMKIRKRQDHLRDQVTFGN